MRLLSLFFLAFFFSLQSIAAENELIVATKHSPPFAMKNAEGEWEGISIDLMHALAEKGKSKLTFKEMSLTEMLKAVEQGEVDAAAAAITITKEREYLLDFSAPYFHSGLAIAVKEKETRWFHMIGRLFSPAFLQVLAALSLLLLISGFLVWLFERKKNSDHFGGTPAQGIWSGFWWAAVTMTTVGYGDKTPITLLGKLVALVWMFTSLMVISGFTAAMTTVLTVESLESEIKEFNDLYGKRVGTVKASSSSSYLEESTMKSKHFLTIQDALHALENDQIDAVVFDEPIMRYVLTLGDIHGVTIINQVLSPEYYAIALPQGSQLRETFNRNLLDITVSERWKKINNKYLNTKQ
uniref:Amino acid ABC transporter substrate-binding protein, PAAT family n=1 Tax=Chlorobium chlorochromatii (strain CaD3) TaxID=340177 RepID=Q3AU06_CHLCH